MGRTTVAKFKLGKNAKVVYISTAVGVTCSLVFGIGAQQYMNKVLKDERKVHTQVMAAKDAQLSKYTQQSVDAWIVSKPGGLKAGDTITETDVQQIKLPDFFVPAGAFPAKREEVVGKTVKLDLAEKTYLLSSVIYSEGKLDTTSRKMEVGYIRLPYKLVSGEKVDVDITFPDGRTYHVITKKKIREADLPAQLIYFDASAEEIFLLNSALVDSYYNNAELRVTQYTEAEMQDKAPVTYVPRTEILDLLQSDPQIVEKAKWANMNALRKSMDQQFKGMLPGTLNIDPGIKRFDTALPDGSGVVTRRSSDKPSAPAAAPVVPQQPAGASSTQPTAQGAAAQPVEVQSSDAPVTGAKNPPSTFGGK